MRIAMIAPTGCRETRALGSERLVTWLAEALVARGHHLVMETADQLRANVDPAGVDVVHGHVGLETAILSRSWRVPALHTFHGAILPQMVPVIEDLNDLTWIALSEAQQAIAPDTNWAATIPPGLPLHRYAVGVRKGDFLVHLGPVRPAQGTHLAIDAARKAGVPLVLATRGEAADTAYVDSEITPRLGDGVYDVGDVDEATAQELLCQAKALLCPLSGTDPSGLHLLEAMAAGTPVIAMPAGVVPEVVVDGTTGIWAADDGELAAAIRSAGTLRPQDCRSHVAQHFSLARMVRAYERLYAEVATIALSA